ncbi:hypothetical protein Q9Q94_11920 [Uliginosibacterium sp. 31-16]|uniref:DUF6701 domain-containing protein n=1 Tax=Uliginosibacterium sp. 31-16 TaxID=3068315 RepID=UPI00273E88CE|nr:DUF6701 domain-containing protein [Uliginosibacterium sp. 31-16]MDP5240239.1 hypothetical protein [Uliginosibacterium sp. 31-16]
MIYLRRFVLGCLLSLVLGSAPLWAAISVYPGVAENLTGNGSVTPSPSGSALSGDVLIAQIVTKAAASITAPSGWTQVNSASTSQNGVQQRIYYLNLGSAPAASYTWIIAGNSANSTAAVIYAVRGAETANCGTASTTNCAGSLQSGGGNQIIAPNIQSQPPTYPAGSLRMAFFASNDGSTSISPNNEGGSTDGVYYRPGAGSTGVGIHASYYLLTSDSNGGQQTASLGGNEGNIGSTFILKAMSAPVLTCVSDNFNRSTGLGSDWVTARISGNFTPAVVSNRLRLTDTAVNESTAVSFQRLFPGAGNYIQLTFKYYGYGGSTADGIAMILSDSSVTPQPGGFGGSMGYAPKGATPGFAGGWLGVGLDEYGNFSNSTDSGACAPGVTSCATGRVQQSVGIRGSASTYYWLAGTSTLSPTVSNSTGHLYRVTVDSRISGRAMLSVERDTSGAGTSYTTLINAFNAAAASGQAAIPANFILSLTGSTGTSTNNHEIDDLQVCAQSMNPMTPQIDHYRFTVTTTPLTCTPASVTVTACMDAACSTTYNGNVTATLTPTGWVGGDTQTFAGSGASLNLSKTTAGTYTLGVSGSTPQVKAFSASLCSINGSAYSSNCALTFADAGLLYTVPAQTSGVTSASVTVTAAKTDDVTRKCVPAFTGSRNIKFWSSYVSPDSAAITGTPQITLNSSVLSTSAASPTTVPLTFDAGGQSSFTLRYPDAGQISLNARYDGSVATVDSGLVMPGGSTFPVVPFALCVDSPDASWNCSATTQALAASCSRFTSAGTGFNLRVTGKAYGSGADSCSYPSTPNYKQSSIPLSSSVFAPSPGMDGALSVASINIVSNGTATVSTSETEVGVFNIVATPAAGNYFSQTVPAGSGRFGRFTPAGFTVGGTLTNRSDIAACNAVPADNTFTYLGEPMSATVTLNAVNAAGTITKNYVGNFARLNLAPVSSMGSNGLAFGAQSGATLLNSRLTASCTNCPAFSDGSTTLSTRLIVQRASGSAVDAPFDPARIGLTISDADSVAVRSPDYDWDLSGTSEGTLLGTTKLYFGRMRVENAYGSPLLSLRVPARAQIWNGTTFVKNLADSCTPLTVPASTAVTTATAPALYCAGGVGLYGGLSGVNGSVSGGALLNGEASTSGNPGILLSKPSNSGGGYLDLVLSVPDYLKYNWDGVDQALPACSTPGDGYLHDDNPRARIRFGTRRNDNIIYLREVY